MPKLITTPFVEIDIEATVTKHLVETTAYNTILKAEWIGFEFLRLDMKEADVLWKVSHFDSAGLKINDTVLSEKIIRTHISNSNKVTSAGVTINHESFPPIKSIDTDGKELLDYSAYDTALAAGHPEFDFWMNEFNWTNKISNAVVRLEALGRFNQE